MIYSISHYLYTCRDKIAERNTKSQEDFLLENILDGKHNQEKTPLVKKCANGPKDR